MASILKLLHSYFSSSVERMEVRATYGDMKLRNKAFLSLAACFAALLLVLGWIDRFDQEGPPMRDDGGGELAVRRLLFEVEQTQTYVKSLRAPMPVEGASQGIAAYNIPAGSFVRSPGDYEFPRRMSITPTTTTADNAMEAPNEEDYGRVLLYITSHFSEQHELYLKHCWTNLLSRSPMLRRADVAVYLNPEHPDRREQAIDVLKDVFGGNDLKVYVKPGARFKPKGEGRAERLATDRQKQSGAINAVRGKSRYLPTLTRIM